MFATSGRAQLAYDSAGVDGGAEVLLIHAGVNDRRSWEHVVRRLSSRHRCVAFDMRGFGETAYEPEDGWSPVADAVAVLEAAGLEQAIVIACSIGGRTAIDLALAHSNRVAGLVLIGAGIRGAPYPDIQEGPTAELNARIEAADAAGDIDEVGRLEAEDIQAIDERAAALIPNARLRFLDGVAHVPHLEADPATLNEIADFVDALA